MSKYLMRSMQPRDMDRLIGLHAEQNERDGTTYSLPRMFRPDGRLDDNIALALCMTKDDVPVQGIYFCTKTVEMLLVGCSPKATLYSARETAAIQYALRSLKYEAVRCLIPHALAEQLTKPMEAAGFRRTDQDFAHFYQELDRERV